jgi:hypothetical protein
MIGRDLKLVPFACACIVIGIEFHYQNLGFHWCQVSWNLPTFYIQMIWPQQGHYKKVNNLGFGSIHIVGPCDPKYLQQWQICELGTKP